MQTAMKLRELTVHYSVKKTTEGRPITIGKFLRTPADSAAAFQAVLEDEATEVFGMLCVTTKHQVIAYYEVSRGTLDATLVHPREVFKAAILANAAAVVVAHNHPSGDPTPSADDRALTTRLKEAGEVLGIPILDHIILADGRAVSLKQIGWL